MTGYDSASRGFVKDQLLASYCIRPSKIPELFIPYRTVFAAMELAIIGLRLSGSFGKRTTAQSPGNGDPATGWSSAILLSGRPQPKSAIETSARMTGFIYRTSLNELDYIDHNVGFR